MSCVLLHRANLFCKMMKPCQLSYEKTFSAQFSLLIFRRFFFFFFSPHTHLLTYICINFGLVWVIDVVGLSNRCSLNVPGLCIRYNVGLSIESPCRILTRAQLIFWSPNWFWYFKSQGCTINWNIIKNKLTLQHKATCLFGATLDKSFIIILPSVITIFILLSPTETDSLKIQIFFSLNVWHINTFDNEPLSLVIFMFKI